MDTFEFDHNLFNSDAGDKKLFVQFYMHFLENPTRTAEEGRPIYDDTEFVKIFSPGDRTNVIDRPVRPSDKVRFADQYRRFKENKEMQASGTPLAEWPIISRGQAEELKYLGFQTVEQIADANDSAVQRTAGLQDLKNKAKAYLELASGTTKPIEEMQGQIKELTQKLAEATETIQNIQRNQVAAKSAAK